MNELLPVPLVMPSGKELVIFDVGVVPQGRRIHKVHPTAVVSDGDDVVAIGPNVRVIDARLIVPRLDGADDRLSLVDGCLQLIEGHVLLNMGVETSSVQGVGYGLRCRSIGICRSHFVCEGILPHGIPAISQNGLHASNPTGVGGCLSSKRNIDDGRRAGLGRARALLLVPIETVGRKDADQDRCEEEDDQDEDAGDQDVGQEGKERSKICYNNDGAQQEPCTFEMRWGQGVPVLFGFSLFISPRFLPTHQIK